MSDTLYEIINRALFPRWQGRLTDLRVGAAEAEAEGMTAREAFLAGAREGYFAGVSDLVEEGLVQDPVQIPELPAPVGLLDEFH